MNAEPRQIPTSTTNLLPFRLGTWIVQPPRNTVEGPERTVQVEPRIMHVLVCLAALQGEVVSRRALLQTVWPGAVVQEEVLTHAVSQLRRLLGDDARSPQLIETIRKCGYRLNASIEPLEARSRGSSSHRRLSRNLNSPPVAVLLLRLVLVSLVIVAVRYLPRVQSDGRQPSTIMLDAVSLTSLPGYEAHPAVSPDGTRVVFTRWVEIEGTMTHKLHVKQIGAEHVLRLTDTPDREIHPAWSPDGTSIACVTGTRHRLRVGVVPALGGPVRLLSQPHVTIFGLDWSPDGSEIVMAFADDREQAGRLVGLSPPGDFPFSGAIVGQLPEPATVGLHDEDFAVAAAACAEEDLRAVG